MRRLNLLAAMAFLSVVGLAGCSEDGDNRNGGPTDPPPLSGSLELTIITAGEDLDADGYTATLDCGCFEDVAVNGVATLDGVEVGSHMVMLTGIASNCELDGSNPMWVTIEPNNVARVTFSIVCHDRRG